MPGMRTWRSVAAGLSGIIIVIIRPTAGGRQLPRAVWQGPFDPSPLRRAAAERTAW